MKRTRKVSINNLIRKRDKLVNELSNHKYILRGTILSRGNICGNPNCGCKRKQNPRLHGPYKYLSHRSRKKTNMIFLNQKKEKYAVKGTDEYQKLTELIYRISEINFEILRHHYHKLPEEL